MGNSMWHRTRKLSLSAAVAVVVSASASTASAQEVGQEDTTPQVPRPVSELPWSVGLGAGLAYPTISGPQIAGGGTLAPTFTVHAGYTFREHFTVGLEFSGTETNLGRDTPGELFRLGYTPQAECTTCTEKPPGADVVSTSLVFTTVGARAEYAPFGRDGLFVGGTAGLAFMVGLVPQSGFGVGGRVGYRFRASNVMALSIEAGVQGQIYGDTTMYMPFGTAVFRPSF